MDRVEFERPWFLYDYVDPAPKFRKFKDKPKRTRKEYVSEGESEELTDTPPMDNESKAVYVPGYE